MHYFFIGLTVTLLLLSIICQIMIGVLYQNMINETDNMTATDNKLLKQCKLKFANCYRLNGGVSNIPIFAEKFINRLSMGKWSLVTLQHMSGQMVLLSVFISGVGIYAGITKGEGFVNIMPYYIVSFLGLYGYFSISSAVDIQGKKRILKTNLIDYLENHMLKRLEMLPDSLRKVEEAERGADENIKQKSRTNTGGKREIKTAFAKQKEENTSKIKSEISESTQQELEMLLEEFLT